MTSIDAERESKMRDLEKALWERQTGKTALQVELEHTRALLADKTSRQEAHEQNVGGVLESLQQANARVQELEQSKLELEAEVARLRRQMDAMAANAKKVVQ